MATSKEPSTLPPDLTDLPEGWEYQALATLVDDERGISYGIVQPGSHSSNGVPIVRVNNVKSGRVDTGDMLKVSEEIEAKYTRTRLRGGEVLLTLVGSLGESAVVQPELAGCNVARAVGVIPVNEEIGPRWVELCLRSPTTRHFIRSRATTTVQATLNLRDVAQLPVPIPPKTEREAITSMLGTLDDKIELNRKTNEALETLAQTLFRNWFVDIAATRLPKGWRGSTLGEVTENPRRGIQPAEIQPTTPYIGLEHMPRRCIALSDWGHADELESNKFEFERGEILFGKLRPYFHKVGVAPVDGVCSTDILVVRPKSPEWFGFVLGHVSSVELVNHTNAASTGTKMPRASWNDIARFEVALPPQSVAAEFTSLIRPMIDRIIANIHESRTLVELRDALLPKLLSGELRVPSKLKVAVG